MITSAKKPVKRMNRSKEDLRKSKEDVRKTKSKEDVRKSKEDLRKTRSKEDLRKRKEEGKIRAEEVGSVVEEICTCSEQNEGAVSSATAASVCYQFIV